MKVSKICKTSNLDCEDFGYRGKHKHLPPMLKYAPQHIVYNSNVVRLLRFKPSYDDRFVELRKEEITSVRYWNANVCPVIILAYNFLFNQYAIFKMDDLLDRMWTTKRERDVFLFSNVIFKWRNEDEPFEL